MGGANGAARRAQWDAAVPHGLKTVGVPFRQATKRRWLPRSSGDSFRARWQVTASLWRRGGDRPLQLGDRLATRGHLRGVDVADAKDKGFEIGR